jgi:hypothetical protein
LNKAQQLMKGQAPDAKLQPYRHLYASQRQRVKFSLPLWILLDIAFSLIQQTNSVLIVFFFFLHFLRLSHIYISISCNKKFPCFLILFRSWNLWVWNLFINEIYFFFKFSLHIFGMLI